MRSTKQQKPSDSRMLQAASLVFQALPHNLRGKQRLARALLPATIRSRPTSVTTRDGSRMYVPNLFEPIGLSLWLDGVYERAELDFLLRCIATGTFVDVGANIGAYTVPVATRGNQVIAIEPSPAVIPFLRENIELNGFTNVEIMTCAANALDRGSIPLYLPPEAKYGMASSAPQFNVEPIMVQTRSIDSILEERKLLTSVTAMKVDTEGFESSVFEGAHKLLTGDSAPVVLFEFCDWAEDRAFPGNKGLAQRVLQELSYTLAILNPNGEVSLLRNPVIEGSHTILGFPPRMYEVVVGFNPSQRY